MMEYRQIFKNHSLVLKLPGFRTFYVSCVIIRKLNHIPFVATTARSLVWNRVLHYLQGNTTDGL